MICDDSGKPFKWSWEPDAKGTMFPVMDPVEALTVALAEQHLKNLLPKTAIGGSRLTLNRQGKRFQKKTNRSSDDGPRKFVFSLEGNRCK